jgi:hypothetical protein
MVGGVAACAVFVVAIQSFRERAARDAALAEALAEPEQAPLCSGL